MDQDGRDLNRPATDWSESSANIASEQTPAGAPGAGRSGETAAGRLVPKLGLAQGLALDGWRLLAMTITQLALIGF